MSDYGADQTPDKKKTYDIQVTKGFITSPKTNVMQWTYLGRQVFKLANKQGKTNMLFKLEE